MLQIPSLKQILAPPSFLQGLLNNRTADLYQSSFFIGAGGAVSLACCGANAAEISSVDHAFAF